MSACSSSSAAAAPLENRSLITPEDLKRIQEALESELSKRECKISKEEVLGWLLAVDIERVQNIFSLLPKVVRPSETFCEVSVEELQLKVGKHIPIDVQPIEIIAAMLLKGYETLFSTGVVNGNLRNWTFQAERIIKISPMMIGRLKEGFTSPEEMIEKMGSDTPYKLSEKKEIGCSTIHIYYTKKHIRNKALIDKTSKVYETLILLLNPFSRSAIIIASEGAWRDVHLLCSERFSKHISSYLSPYCEKIHQVSTKYLVGPTSSSDIELSAPLSRDVDQRGALCDSFTITFPLRDGAEESKVRMQFSERGVYIGERMSLEDYEKFGRCFSAWDQHIERLRGSVSDWEIPELPNELVQITDQDLISELNQSVAGYLVDDARFAHYDFSIELANDLRVQASEFNVTVFAHRKMAFSHGHGDAFVPLPFESPPPNLFLQELKKAICAYRGGSELLHPAERWISHLCGDTITLEYRIQGEKSTKPLLESLEGTVTKPDKRVYFKSSGHWYQFTEGYCSKLLTLTAQLEENFLKPTQEGYLKFVWDRKAVGEEDYSRYYPKYETDKAWFDGNRKQIARTEICDIMLATEEDTFLFHLKKVGLVRGDQRIAAALREIGSQLIMSAQIIRGEINKGLTPGTELYNYCNRIKGQRGSPIEAFRKKNIHFVLAIPFPPGDPLEALRNIGSTVARREIIHLKAEVEKLGFHFKIAPIPLQTSTNQQ